MSLSQLQFHLLVVAQHPDVAPIKRIKLRSNQTEVKSELKNIHDCQK